MDLRPVRTCRWDITVFWNLWWSVAFRMMFTVNFCERLPPAFVRVGWSCAVTTVLLFGLL